MCRWGSDLTCYMTGLILALPPFINKTSSSTSIASMTVKFVCFTDKTHSKANFCKITNLTFNILFSIVRLKNGTQKRDQNVTKLRKAIRAFPYKGAYTSYKRKEIMLVLLKYHINNNYLPIILSFELQWSVIQNGNNSQNHYVWTRSSSW